MMDTIDKTNIYLQLFLKRYFIKVSLTILIHEYLLLKNN